MPFEHGTFSVMFFKLNGRLPKDYLELFAGHCAGMLENVKDEPQVGWVSGRHLLDTQISEESALCGGHLYLNLRTAERKIPAVLLKAICRREELVYMQANQTVSVPSKVRRDIKADAVEKHQMKMVPSISGLPMVLDMKEGIIYLGTASAKQMDNFVSFFFRTLEIEPVPLSVAEIMQEMFKTGEEVLPEIMLSDRSDAESVPARDFLTWFWYYSEKEGGRISLGQFGEFEAMIEGPLTFAFTSEARGSAETTVKKGGSPLRAAEAKAALTVGKKLKKAKITIVRGEDIWSGTFDADRFAFSGLTLPEGEEMEHNSRFAERILNLYIFRLAVLEYFRKFVETVRGDNWAATEADMRQWAQERDSY